MVKLPPGSLLWSRRVDGVGVAVAVEVVAGGEGAAAVTGVTTDRWRRRRARTGNQSRGGLEIQLAERDACDRVVNRRGGLLDPAIDLLDSREAPEP